MKCTHCACLTFDLPFTVLQKIHEDELTTRVCDSTQRLGVGVVLIGQDIRKVYGAIEQFIISKGNNLLNGMISNLKHFFF